MRGLLMQLLLLTLMSGLLSADDKAPEAKAEPGVKAGDWVEWKFQMKDVVPDEEGGRGMLSYSCRVEVRTVGKDRIDAVFHTDVGGKSISTEIREFKFNLPVKDAGEDSWKFGETSFPYGKKRLKVRSAEKTLGDGQSAVRLTRYTSEEVPFGLVRLELRKPQARSTEFLMVLKGFGNGALPKFPLAEGWDKAKAEEKTNRAPEKKSPAKAKKEKTGDSNS